MTNIHDRARQLVLESRGTLSHGEALAELSRRGHEVRRMKVRRNHGVLHVTNTDRKQFESVEQPARNFWWRD